MTATPEPEVADLHALLSRRTQMGTHAVCRCGAWEGWWHDQRSREWCLDDHDHHRRAASNGGNLPPVQ